MNSYLNRVYSHRLTLINDQILTSVLSFYALSAIHLSFQFVVNYQSLNGLLIRYFENLNSADLFDKILAGFRNWTCDCVMSVFVTGYDSII